MSKSLILVIDDEADLVELLRYNLEREGFSVLAAANGEAGLDSARRHGPEAIVLDLMLPGMDGLELCRNLKRDDRTSRIPLIMLTAKVAETDRIVGLEMGADDYVTKPFSPRELVARVRAVLRRSSLAAGLEQIIHLGDLHIDARRHEVRYAETMVPLTATEFRILRYLAGNAGRVLSRDQIMREAIAPDSDVFDRTIDVHITAIRRKLGGGSALIETVRGFGYKLSDRPAP